jgi:hypothetical protein
MEVIDTGNDHVFGFVRAQGCERVAVLADFSEQLQAIAAYHLSTQGFGQTSVIRFARYPWLAPRSHSIHIT